MKLTCACELWGEQFCIECKPRKDKEALARINAAVENAKNEQPKDYPRATESQIERLRNILGN
jgi:hypothetical protein